MEWFELIINPGSADVSEIEGAICMCGINSWAIEDKSDLEDFLQRNKELWDYVDQSLLERKETLIKIYLPDNPQGRDMPPLPLRVLLFGIPAGCILGTLKVLADRIREIRKGEEDAYRNY